MPRRLSLRVDSKHGVKQPRSLDALRTQLSQNPSASDESQTASPDRSSDSASTEMPNEPHALERTVLHALLAQTKLRIEALVVRRMPDGLCLQGVLQCEDSGIDVVSIVRRVAGVERVLNQLVMRSPTMQHG